MNPADLQDPRIQQLIAALKGRQPGGQPMFGGGPKIAGGGPGMRSRADYFRPGFAGINYNPFQAQMAQGAQGILGLNSGRDMNAPASVPGGDPAGGATGVAPQIGDAITGGPAGGPPSYSSPAAGNAAAGGQPLGGYTQNPDGTYSPTSDIGQLPGDPGNTRRPGQQGFLYGRY